MCEARAWKGSSQAALRDCQEHRGQTRAVIETHAKHGTMLHL
jgi:hypothetical protein